jgi:hypothetical protein
MHQAAQARALGGMTLFEVKDLVALLNLARLLDATM